MTSFVGAALMGLSNASASNRAIILAALAIVSAILSNFAGHDGILRVAVWEVPLLPGVFCRWKFLIDHPAGNHYGNAAASGYR